MKKTAALAVRSLLMSTMISGISHAQIKADDLSYLTPDTLPPMKLVLEAALNALPRTLKELQDYDTRMRLAALAPNLQVRWRTFEGPSRRVDSRDQVLTRETRGQTSSQSGNSAQNTVNKIAADPLDSFIQDTSNEASGFNRGSSSQWQTETRYNVPVALSDEEVWRNEYSAQLTWQLSNLFYHPDELKAAAAARIVAVYRDEHISRVVSLYRTFCKSVAQFARNPNSEEAFFSVEDKLVILDNITDNFISEYAMSRQLASGTTAPTPDQPAKKNKNDVDQRSQNKSKEQVPATLGSASGKSSLSATSNPHFVQSTPISPTTLMLLREEDDSASQDGSTANASTSLPGDGLDPRARSLTGERGEWEEDDDRDLDEPKELEVETPLVIEQPVLIEIPVETE